MEVESVKKPITRSALRPHQPLPDEITSHLLDFVRTHFYAESPKQFYQDRRFLLRVVTWPAAWLSSRAVTLQPERYQAIVIEVLRGIMHHGKTDAVKYWPGYLLHCIQEHFKHHGEAIYEEAKSLRTCLEHAFLGIAKAKAAAPSKTVETLAQVNRVLTAPRRSKQASRPSKQLDLL